MENLSENENSDSLDSFFSSKDIQQINGCYYRVIVAYKVREKTETKKIAWIDDYDYKKYAEEYTFFISQSNSNSVDPRSLPKKVLTPSGSAVNTGKDNGFSGSNTITKVDPHYGWDIGKFYINGYTRETTYDENAVFLKNVRDKVALWFKLDQDINKLNGDSHLTIANDNNGYDTYFHTSSDEYYFKHGALIIQYTDEEGEKHNPVVYTDYLAANAKTGADTKVELFEEGDYEVALDYEIKNNPRQVGPVSVVPTYTDYRMTFKFSIRNGNCMVYPFDLNTGAELANDSFTESGFRLDMAKSKYLNVDIKRSILQNGSNGLIEDTRFNKPARDGEEYTDEGIYTFTVSNRYTGETTTKTIYVGTNPLLKAYVASRGKYSIQDIEAMEAEGYSIESNGNLIAPSAEESEQSSQAVSEDGAESPEASFGAVMENEVTATSVQDSSESKEEDSTQTLLNSLRIPLIACICIAFMLVVFIVVKEKRRKNSADEGGNKR